MEKWVTCDVEPYIWYKDPMTGHEIHSNRDESDEETIRKPSLLSQIVPYLFTGAILIYVFTGLSSNVVDERHTLSGTEWSALEGSGAKTASVKVASPVGAERYCGVEMGEEAPREVCPAGPDFEIGKDPVGDGLSIRRTKTSRIHDGQEVSVSYVKKVKLSEMWAMVSGADLTLFLPVMILHVLVFFLGDILSFGLSYRWFNAPDLTLGEIMEVRGGPYVIQVGLAALAEILFPLYMWRVKKVPVTRTVSANVWTMVVDFAAILTAITPAVIYNIYFHNLIPAVGLTWLLGCAAFWTVFGAGIIFWRTPPGRRVVVRITSGHEGGSGESGIKKSFGGASQLAWAFSQARWHHIVRCYLVRFGVLLSGLLSNYLALRALGADPSLPLAIIGIPIVILSIFLPVGVGGYGGPQLIAWFLFVKLGGAGTADQIIAYSLLWSTGFLVGRAVIGLIFIRGFWKRCFSGRSGH